MPDKADNMRDINGHRGKKPCCHWAYILVRERDYKPKKEAKYKLHQVVISANEGKAGRGRVKEEGLLFA